MIVAIDPPNLPIFWQFAVRHLQRYNLPKPLHEVYADCYSGHLTPWMVVTDRPVAVVLMAKVGTEATIWFAGGDCLDEWEAEVVYLAFLWSRDNCDGSVYIEGRKGWQRRLSKYGFVRRGDTLWAASPASRPLP